MINIPLKNISNQSFAVTLDNNYHDITIKETNGVMSITIIRNNETIISNYRLTAGSLIMPCRYQELGNFVLLTKDGDIPYYDQFSITQFLIYITIDELSAFYAAA